MAISRHEVYRKKQRNSEIKLAFRASIGNLNINLNIKGDVESSWRVLTKSIKSFRFKVSDKEERPYMSGWPCEEDLGD